MAGYQLNVSTDGSSDWSQWANALEKVWKGYIGVSLNNWDTTGVPSVAEGGILEVGGSIFYFGDTEAITGSASTANLNYIMATVSSTNVAVSYTTVAPSWIADKVGWYDATEAKRYIGGCGIDLGMKFKYDKGQNNRMEKTINIGVWCMTSTNQIAIAESIPFAYIKDIEAMIYNDSVNNLTAIDIHSTGAVTGGWIAAITNEGIALHCNENGYYDNATFDSTTINRGFAIISYEV